MINFTVGPVQSPDYVCEIGGEQVPYFRTDEFSQIVFESERIMKSFVNATDDSKVVFLTGSGTAAMEATVINTLTPDDKAIVVNGGSFGQRFVDLCKWHSIPYDELKLEAGYGITSDQLAQYSGKGYTTFLVNMHETSTGVLYDMEMISKFCKEEGLFLIVDGISSFLADFVDMQKFGIGVFLTGSQKALACAPGVSVVVLSTKALDRVSKTKSCSMYLDFSDALKNAERGQTPFTPAVGVIRQIHKRLKTIEEAGGVSSEMNRMHELAVDFRKRIEESGLPFELFSKSPSNAVTSLYSPQISAYEVFLRLKDEYGIWVCPNGGAFKDIVFRVGHIGSLTIEDNKLLVKSMVDLINKMEK